MTKLLAEQDLVEVIKGDNYVAITNGATGGWVKTKDGSLVSVEYARSLNRVQRRKEGIKL